jgi:hypothetical protein
VIAGKPMDKWPEADALHNTVNSNGAGSRHGKVSGAGIPSAA